MEAEPTLRSMLRSFPPMPGSIFNADRAFDAEMNFELIHELRMSANIKQVARQEGPKGRGARGSTTGLGQPRSSTRHQQVERDDRGDLPRNRTSTTSGRGSGRM